MLAAGGRLPVSPRVWCQALVWRASRESTTHFHPSPAQQLPYRSSCSLRTHLNPFTPWWRGGGWLGVRGLATGITTRAQNITSVTEAHCATMLKVSWGTEGSEEYPYVWLRDNCCCQDCYHRPSMSRLTHMAQINLQAKPFSIQVMDEGRAVEVVWNDGHKSSYEASWLFPRGFSEARRQQMAAHYRLERKYWGSELSRNFPEVSFQEVMADDAALLDWLRQLEIHGFVLVNGAPTERGQVRRLAERIAFIKRTHYGEEFTVTAKPDPSNVAYLSNELQLHADLPYYEYKPGVQFIHCIVQYEGRGAESLVADAVHVARELKKNYPEHYTVLTKTLVDWFDIGTDEGREFNKALRRPVICTDEGGEIYRINMSQPQRNSHFSVPARDVAPWYAALRAYYQMLSDPKYCIHFKMIPGTIQTFDNLRVVHGRTSYQSGKGKRVVEGCYVDWDEVRSRRRVLESKIHKSH